MIYESGCRLSEIASLTPNSITFNEYGAQIQVKGKTGQRATVNIIWFANALRQFLEKHPNRDNPSSFLWYWYNGRDELEPLGAGAIRKRLERACEAAHIRHINPQLLRHSRGTELAKELPEQTLKAIMGWTPDSKMAKRYVHKTPTNYVKTIYCFPCI